MLSFKMKKYSSLGDFSWDASKHAPFFKRTQMQGSPGIQKRVKVTPEDGLPVSVCQECTRTPSSMAKRAVEE